ncbi:MAG: hypothetical protein AAGN66_01595 [Acidobacteriota bacterium]
MNLRIPLFALVLALALSPPSAPAEQFTQGLGNLTYAGNNPVTGQIEGASPQIYQRTDGSWMMILQQNGFFWGCNAGDDKLGVLTTNANPPVGGWRFAEGTAAASRIGNCDNNSTWGAGGVVSRTLSSGATGPYYLLVDRGIVPDPNANPDAEKHYIYVWESDDGRNWRDEKLLIDASAAGVFGNGQLVLYSAPFVISQSFNKALPQAMRVGFFFSTAPDGNQNPISNIGYGYIDILNWGNGGPSTYNVKLLASDGTYKTVPANGQVGFDIGMVLPLGANNRMVSYSEIVDRSTREGRLWVRRQYQTPGTFCCLTADPGNWVSRVDVYDFTWKTNGELDVLGSSSPVTENLPGFCNPREERYGVNFPAVWPPERTMNGQRLAFVNFDYSCNHQNWGPFRIRALKVQ